MSKNNSEGNLALRGSLVRAISVPILNSKNEESKEKKKLRRESAAVLRSVEERRKETQFEIEKMRKLLTEKLTEQLRRSNSERPQTAPSAFPIPSNEFETQSSYISTLEEKIRQLTYNHDLDRMAMSEMRAHFAQQKNQHDSEVESYLHEINELSQLLKSDKQDEPEKLTKLQSENETLLKTIEDLRIERDKLVDNLGRTHKREEEYKEKFMATKAELETIKETMTQTIEKTKKEDAEKTQIISELKLQNSFLQDNVAKLTLDLTMVSTEKQRMLELQESQAGNLLQLKKSLQEDFDKEKQLLLDTISRVQEEKKESQTALEKLMQDIQLNGANYKDLEMEMKSEIAKLNSQIEHLSRDNSELKKSLETSTNELNTTKSKKSQLKEEVIKLKTELDLFHKDKAVKELQFSTVVDQQERTQKLAEKDKERLEAEVASLQKQLLEYFEKDKIKREQDYANNSRASEENFKNVLQVLQEEISSAKKSRDQAEGVLSTKKNKWKQAKGELTSSIKLQTTQLENLRSQIQELQSNFTAAQLEIQTKSKDMQTLQATIEDLNKQMKLDKLQEENTAKQVQLLTIQLKEAQKDLEKHIEQVERLNKEKDEIKSSSKTEITQSLSSLKFQLEEERALTLNLRMTSDQAQSAAFTEKQSFLKEKSQLQQQIDTLTTQLSDLKIVNEKLKDQIEAASIKETDILGSHTTVLQESHFKLERAIKKGRKLSHLLENASREVARLGQENANLKSQLESIDIESFKVKTTELFQLHQATKECFLLTKKAAEIQKKKIVKILPVLVSTITNAINQHMSVAIVTAKQYKKELKLRKQLFNQLQESRGSVRVYLRVRDFTASETDSTCVPSCSFPQKNHVSIENSATGKTETFQFERVFNMATTQSAVFTDVQQFVTSLLDGYNVSILAYGQTGSGKTYTLEGPRENPGLLVRLLQEMFRLTGELQGTHTFEFKMNILEIHNENLRDLLGKDKDKKHEIKQLTDGNVHVSDIHEVVVSSLDEVLQLVILGKKNRALGITTPGERSDRSHLIFQITVTTKNLLQGDVTTAKLAIVDLAGCERLPKNSATEHQLSEAQSIYRSLSTLGDVLEALRAKKQTIPYKNSKLTYLLQDCLGGTSKVLVFLHVCPHQTNTQETLSTLYYGSRIRAVEFGAM